MGILQGRDDFEKKGVKRSNLTIYPIIVHTNHLYTTIDVTDYLDDEFNPLIAEYNLTVKSLVLIELETLFRFIEYYRGSKHALKHSLDRYFKIKRTGKKNLKNRQAIRGSKKRTPRMKT